MCLGIICVRSGMSRHAWPYTDYTETHLTFLWHVDSVLDMLIWYAIVDKNYSDFYLIFCLNDIHQPH